MDKSICGNICTDISQLSPYVRFVGIIGKTGELLAYKRRTDLIPLLDEKNTNFQFTHVAVAGELEATFDKSLGQVKFVWEERGKVQTLSFVIGQNKAWVSVDKKVIRTEVLRIIDQCFLIVKRYSDNQQEE